MSNVFDYRESTISYDYEKREVEFYFTRESNFEKCKKRNPQFLKAEELNPGFILIYPFNQCRTPDYVLRVAPKPPENASKTTVEGK